MLEIAYTLHRGKVSRQQQDCLLINDALHQAPALAMKTRRMAVDEALLAIEQPLSFSMERLSLSIIRLRSAVSNGRDFENPDF